MKLSKFFLNFFLLFPATTRSYCFYDHRRIGECSRRRNDLRDWFYPVRRNIDLHLIDRHSHCFRLGQAELLESHHAVFDRRH